MKRIVEKLLPAFAIVLIVLVGCSDEENPATPAVPVQSGLMPLGIGYSWTYQMTVNPSDSLHMHVDTVRWSIVSAVTLENELWYEYSSTAVMGWEFYRNRSSGLWRRVRDDRVITISDPIFVAKYPAEPGEYFSDLQGDHILVSSVDKQVVVPAGAFLCTEYVDADTSYLVNPPSINRYHRYYSPGVGLIRQEYFFRATDGRDLLSTKWVLLSYSQ